MEYQLQIQKQKIHWIFKKKKGYYELSMKSKRNDEKKKEQIVSSQFLHFTPLSAFVFGIQNIQSSCSSSCEIKKECEKKNNQIIQQKTLLQSIEERKEERKSLEIQLQSSILHENDIQVEFHIPSSIRYYILWIGLFDFFEPNNEKWIQKHLTMKQHCIHLFQGLKRGKYLIKLFANRERDQTNYVPLIQSEIIIGSFISLTYKLSYNNNHHDTISISLNDENESGWIGIYSTSSSKSIPNEYYQLWSSISSSTSTIFSISHLPQGTYECRFFSSESANGILLKTYHCSGNCFFTI